MVRPLFIYRQENDVNHASIGREALNRRKNEVNNYGKRKRNNTEHRHNND